MAQYPWHREPTIMDCFASEDKMCEEFMRLVKQNVMYGKMLPNSVVHIPNGQRGKGKSYMLATLREKRLGAVKGAPDYLIRLPDAKIGWFEAKFFECKSLKTKTTIKATEPFPEQVEFREQALARGEKHAYFYTPNEGIDILEKWGVITNHAGGSHDK